MHQSAGIAIQVGASACIYGAKSGNLGTHTGDSTNQKTVDVADGTCLPNPGSFCFGSSERSRHTPEGTHLTSSEKHGSFNLDMSTFLGSFLCQDKRSLGPGPEPRAQTYDKILWNNYIHPPALKSVDCERCGQSTIVSKYSWMSCPTSQGIVQVCPN